MAMLTQRRCFHHAGREAAARCPECGHFYCRECVTEHQGRVVCAACLGRPAKRHARGRIPWRGMLRFALGCLGFLLLWGWFLLLGQAIITAGDSFHEKTANQSE